MKKIALVLSVVTLLSSNALANYTSCTTTCYGNSCTTTCY